MEEKYKNFVEPAITIEEATLDVSEPDVIDEIEEIEAQMVEEGYAVALDPIEGLILETLATKNVDDFLDKLSKIGVQDD